MWKRRNLYQSKHPFNENPFEALFYGSWRPVELIRISQGNMTICSADARFEIEERGPFPDVRVRSRQATLSDCACFLRVGIDVCVLSSAQDSITSRENSQPVWTDARICSIARKPHEARCFCQFYVKLYTSQGPLGSEKGELSKETTLVGINQISILQKLDSKHTDDHLYRWNFSEDCTTIQRTKLFLGKFVSEISWLIVTSALKKTAFAVRSLDNKLIYQILGGSGHGNYLYLDSCFKTVNFKVENEVLIPVVVEHVLAEDVALNESESAIITFSDFSDLRRSKRRIIQPDRFLGCDVSKLNICTHLSGLIKIDKGKDKEDDNDEDDELTLPLAVLFGRRGRPSLKSIQGERKTQPHGNNSRTKLVQSDEHKPVNIKRRIGRPRKFVSKPVIGPQKKDENELAIVPVSSEYVPLAVNQNHHSTVNVSRVRSRENEKRYYYPAKTVPRDESRSYQDLDDMDIDTSWVRRPADKRTQRKRYRSFKLRPDCLTEERIYGQKTLSAGLYKDLINSYMKNINTTVNKEEPPLTDQWKERRPRIFTDNRNAEKTSPVEEEEESEIDMLWKEMELCMTSSYLFEDNEGSKVESNDEYMEETVNSCQHEYILDEEIGILCKLCGVVTTEIKDVSPEFVQSTTWAADHKMSRGGFEFDHEQAEDETFELFHNSPSTGPNLSEESENVRNLVSDLWKKLHVHQKKAFDFLWRNIAGSLIPADMDEKSKRTGGCVISHTPGAGKTFLIIAFLVSYLKLFPGKRPLVLAPKTTLYTWHKEFVKWQIPIPVYLIHGRRSYRVFKQNTMTLEGLPKPGQDVMHVLDCLEKIQKWHTQPSVLVMGYTSFLTLMRENSKFAHRKYMAKVLRESPGILILDEGHNPRSTKSRLRKVLMKVETDLRILLSGTLFQNNFCEYFNTLCLARPKFVHEVLMELDPKFKRKKKKKARHLLEARARKFFIDNIGKKIDSNNGEERIQGLNMLRNITNEFIDVYEAGTNENLPGLQIYTLLMNPTDIQLQVLLKLHRIMATYHGYPLELELLITIGSIHPWLVKSACCAGKFFSDEELMQLERHKYDIKKGSKVKFVLSLVYRVFRKEKVLIFCHNIAPINLFLELFEMVFGWHKGKEILVITGDLELFERGRVMDQFEEPGGASRVLLASITACAEGVSLTAASRVILLDSEWNPSKTKQAIARAFRPGQQKMVYVYQLLAANTLEEDKYRRTTWKEWVSSMIFSEAFVEDPACWQAQKMEDEILREMVEEDKSKSIHMIMKNEKASTI